MCGLSGACDDDNKDFNEEKSPGQKLIKGFVCICKECDQAFKLVEEYFIKQELEKDHVPFGAKSSNSTFFCPKCKKGFSFRINYVYKWKNEDD